MIVNLKEGVYIHMSSENRMICDNHLDIQMDADQIIKSINEIQKYYTDYDEVKKELDKIHIAAVHAKSCAKNAMRQGQRMEKRLLRYFRAICGLGFERKEKV